MEDEEISAYVRRAIDEAFLGDLESQILTYMKKRQERYPSDRNDLEWQEYSEMFVWRKYYHMSSSMQESIKHVLKDNMN